MNGNNIKMYYDYRPKDAELEFDWLITNQCNFNCRYCFPKIKENLKSKPQYKKLSLNYVVNIFNKTEKICHAFVSGGEPFLYPNFTDFAVAFTKKHYLSIYSNFSSRLVWDFLKKTSPATIVNIFPAVHIHQREKVGKNALDDFIEKVLYAQRLGFNIHCIYILYPPLLKRFYNDVDFLHQSGIESVNLKVFKGMYYGKSYPESYTSEQNKIISSFANNYPYTKPYLDNNRYLKGKICNAGVRFFRIAPNGDVTRCAAIDDLYGNIYANNFKIDEKPKPCTANKSLTLTSCYNYLVDDMAILK